jgi:hypothetical protein
MPRERPTVVTVFGILNLVFGGLGLFCAICGGVMLAFMYAALSAAGSGGGLNIKFPGVFTGYMIFAVVDGFIMSIVLVAGGIGLMQMQAWGRWASIFYGVVTILTSLAGLVFQIAYLNPAMEKWNRDLQADIQKQQQARGVRGAPPPPNPAAGFSGSSNPAGAVAGAVIGMAYSIALLIAMFLPQVSAAFASGPARRLDEEGPYPEGGGHRQEGGPDYGIQPYR